MRALFHRAGHRLPKATALVAAGYSVGVADCGVGIAVDPPYVWRVGLVWLIGVLAVDMHRTANAVLRRVANIVAALQGTATIQQQQAPAPRHARAWVPPKLRPVGSSEEATEEAPGRGELDA